METKKKTFALLGSRALRAAIFAALLTAGCAETPVGRDSDADTPTETTGTVSGSTSGGVGSVYVRAKNTATGDWDAYVVTYGGGPFVIYGVPPGSFLIEAADDHLRTGSYGPVSVVAGEVVDGVFITLTK